MDNSSHITKLRFFSLYHKQIKDKIIVAVLKKRYLCRRMRQFRQQIISYLLLLTIGFYLGGSTLFVHSHNIDGIKIVHSHPFSGNPASHSHSSSSVDTISRLQNTFGVVAECVAISDNTTFIEQSKATPVTLDICSAESSLSLLRAPPVLV